MFMSTLISCDVKHKEVKLDKRVVELLLEMPYEKCKDFVLSNGALIVDMDKIS